MCLAVPGQVVDTARDEDDPLTGFTGTVDFQGSKVNVNLSMTPEIRVGSWVLVHAGYAISVLDEQEARETWEYMAAAGAGEVPAALREDDAESAEPRPH